jgi:hypothetical protein
MALSPAALATDPYLKPEYRNIVDNIWKNKKQYLIDTITAKFNASPPDNYVLYTTADNTANLLLYAKALPVTAPQRAVLLDGLAEVYLSAYAYLENDTQYVYCYWPVSPYPFRSIHPLAVSTNLWVGGDMITDNGYTLRMEGILESSQFLYELAQLCNAITDISSGSRTANMNTFLSNFVPVIRDDHYKRYVCAATNYGRFEVKGWGGQVGLYNHKDFMQKKHDLYFDANPDKSYMNAVTDTDMFILAGVVEMLAANSKDSINVPINSTFKANLLAYVTLCSDLLSDRTTSSSLTNFTGTGVTGANFDLGVWDGYPDYYYSGYTGSASPSGQAHSPADNVGWDISHARRFVRVFGSLYENLSITGQTFPSLTTMQSLANQLVYGAFNKDLDSPKTSNFMDGTNGWYRVDYGGFSGYGVYGMCYSTATGGYGFWSKFNTDITLMENAIWNKIKLLHTSDVSGHFRNSVVAFQMYKYGSVADNIYNNPNSESGYVKFDSNNKYISPGLDTDYLTSQGTIEFWYKSDADANNYPVVIRDGTTTNYLRVRHNYANQTITLQINVNGSSQVSLQSTATLTVGEWNHIAVTGYGANAKIYINGALAGTSGANTYWTSHITDEPYISISDSSYPAKGKIDDVRIYSKALSATDIATDYKMPRLMAKWTFDNTGDQYYSNSFSLLQPGKVGANGASFNGSNQYFRSFASPDFSGTTGSIQMWVNPADSTALRVMLQITPDGTTTSNYLCIQRTAPNQIRVVIRNSSALVVDVSSVATINTPDAWNHVAVTQDGTGVKIYINGVLSSVTGTNSGSYWTSHITSATPYIMCGQTAWSGNKDYGRMDELQIYRGALSDNDVKKDYLAGKCVYNRTFDWSTETYSYFNATPDPDGKICDCVSFDGSTQKFRSTAETNLASATGTVQMWVNPADSAALRVMFQITPDGTTTSNYLFVERLTTNKIRVVIRNNSASVVDVSSVATINTPNAWNHVAVTQDGTGVKIYINGVLSSVTGTNSGLYWTSHITSAPPYIMCGQTAWSGNKDYGKMDELQVYNYALSGTQITQEFNRGALSVRWEFDETRDAAIMDWVKIYYCTESYGERVVLDYNLADSIRLLKFLPSFLENY